MVEPVLGAGEVPVMISADLRGSGATALRTSSASTRACGVSSIPTSTTSRFRDRLPISNDPSSRTTPS